MSRDQARVLAATIPGVGRVELDFAGVEWIGPSFADELFRVFATNHPEIRLIPKNAGPEVAKMISRTTAGARSGS